MTSYQSILELESYLDNLFILFELSLGFIEISRCCFGFFVLDHALKKICADIGLGPWHVISTPIQNHWLRMSGPPAGLDALPLKGRTLCISWFEFYLEASKKHSLCGQWWPNSELFLEKGIICHPFVFCPALVFGERSGVREVRMINSTWPVSPFWRKLFPAECSGHSSPIKTSWFHP